jgi:alpha,alpha-trehalase
VANDTPIPYAPIARHGVIGDRRCAALIAADGTLDWLCLPRYDSEPAFGALLDARKGGYFRFGPAARIWGEQRYREGTTVLETRYRVGRGELHALDAMLLHEADGSIGEDSRVVVRHLSARRAAIECVLDARPRRGADTLSLFCSRIPAHLGSTTTFTLRPGEDAWAVLAYGDPSRWTPERAQTSLTSTARTWLTWSTQLQYEGPYRDSVMRSLVTIRQLGYAPAGSTVAAATTSLPERIGGSWNADYRLAWVRDSSLALQALARHGDHASAQAYLEWLTSLGSTTEAPLQVVYSIDGGERPEQQEREDFAGYRHSAPVRFGNHAAKQKQLGCGAYLAACAATYLHAGAPFRPEYFELIAREADYSAQHWDESDNGIWELSERRDHVSSRVASWVTMAHACDIAEALGRPERAKLWRAQMACVKKQVLERGYSQRRRAFVQEYRSDGLDASALLIPILGFLPGDDPRVVSTVDAIARELTIDGHVYRFVPDATAGIEPDALGAYEGSFTLCTCWLAAAYALGGRANEAADTLERLHRLIGSLGLFAEGVDARTGEFLGNYPLLFSHAEYIRAVTEFARLDKR